MALIQQPSTTDPAPEFNRVAHDNAEHHLRSNWDVSAGSPSDGQVLTYRGSDKMWVPGSAGSTFVGCSATCTSISADTSAHALTPDAIDYDFGGFFYGSGMDLKFVQAGYYRVTLFFLLTPASTATLGYSLIFPSVTGGANTDTGSKNPVPSALPAMKGSFTPGDPDITSELSFVFLAASNSIIDPRFVNDTNKSWGTGTVRIQAEYLGNS